MFTRTALVILFASASTCLAAAELPNLRNQKKSPPMRLTACASLGPGFYQVNGSSTCVRVGGYVSADYVYHSAPRNDLNAQNPRN